MKNFKLHICRDRAFVGAAMPYRIIINGVETSKLGIGKSLVIEIPNTQSTLKVSMVGNSFIFHKIEKTVVLYPQYCNNDTVNCKIRTKLNWFGFLTLGLLQAVGRVELKIYYH